MCIVRADLRIVTSNHCNCTTDNTRCYTLKERFGGSGYIYLAVGNTVKYFHKCFQRISNSCFLLHIRDIYKIRFTVLEVFTCSHNDLFCFLCCGSYIKTDVIGIRHLSDRRSCDELGMETFAQRSKCREDTLNVYYDSLTCSSQDYILLLQEVTSHRNTTTHCYFVGSTADTRYGDSLSAHALCICDHLRIICIFTDHLGQ